MTNTKQCCGNCHWFRDERFEYHANGIAGTCVAPRPESAMNMGTMRTDEGETCPTFRQRGERLPQRFRVWIASNWSYGICWPMRDGRWSMQCLNMHSTFTDDPTELIGTLFGDAELEWIDRDFFGKDA